MSAFSRSNPDRNISWRDVLILSGVVLFSLGVYVVSSAFAYRYGFPLDDAWIHQTYARNLALRGEWSFLPGEPSAGSTAPLWTVLLSMGFLLHLSPYIWTYLLGAIFLLLTSIQAESILRQVASGYKPIFPWVGCFFALEWHLLWAAFSGMETILFIFLVLWATNLLLTENRHFTLAGTLIGLSIWVRPDGLTLLAPFILAIIIKESTNSARLGGIMRLLFGFTVFFLPYLVFNLAISGHPMPNTFYAKQAEYAGWQATPLAEKMFYFSLQFFQGISFILIPVFILELVQALRQQKWGIILATVWSVGYIFLYTMRLPVYQHGRYLLPALSVFLVIGAIGFVEILEMWRETMRIRISTVYQSLFVVVLAISFIFGGFTYAQDVAFIEREMVDTAKWVARNIPAGGEIAAHDIGALGYFGNHRIIDLAGLISPDIVPIINDELRLSAYLDEHGVQYLEAFSGWKPVLTSRGKQIFIVSDFNDLSNNLGSMAVFRWVQR